MAELPKHTIRPFSRPARSDQKDAFRIYLSPSTLLLHKLRAGDPCYLTGSNGPSQTAVAWTAPEKIQDNVVQTSKVLQTLYGFRLGDKVSISRHEGPFQDVVTVCLREVSECNGHAVLPIEATQTDHWEWLLEHPLSKAEFISTGMIFEDLEYKDFRRAFIIKSINGQTWPNVFRFTKGSKARLESTEPDEQSTLRDNHCLEISGAGIGGLGRQICQINERLSAYTDGHSRLKMPPWFRRRRGGILLYGPSGTGKTLLLGGIASAKWRKVLFLDDSATRRSIGDGEATVRRVFADALRSEPSVIIADQLENIAGKAGGPEGFQATSLVYALIRELDAAKGSKVLFVAATRRLIDIHESLRVPGRLDFEVEVPIPDAIARIDILKTLQDLPSLTPNAMLDRLGERTHGYVGADLMALLQSAAEKAESRYLLKIELDEAQPQGNGHATQHDTNLNQSEEEDTISVELTETDFDLALTDIEPTAMREVFLETPKVRWGDIGGQHMVKQSLKEAVEWPFKYASEMERLGMEPKKGLLLYGPPGCSKTLIAKAVATEAGLNFIAIKGGELLSMYVGESERAVREIFRKARAASPSIVFFDEIDAIGSARGEGASHSGLNVLTTLLNEMDGIEVLKGVFVLAATNKPEILDPALMRPGRIDTILYVGLPDSEARKEILDIRLRKMDVKEDIPVAELVEKTEGYSGAEVVTICQRASYTALKVQEDTGVSQKVSREHFERAIGEVSPMTTPEMLSSFETWASRGTKDRRHNRG